jgi:hypothetical protein
MVPKAKIAIGKFQAVRMGIDGPLFAQVSGMIGKMIFLPKTS